MEILQELERRCPGHTTEDYKDAPTARKNAKGGIEIFGREAAKTVATAGNRNKEAAVQHHVQPICSAAFGSRQLNRAFLHTQAKACSQADSMLPLCHYRKPSGGQFQIALKQG